MPRQAASSDETPEPIRFEIASTSLGPLLVAATSRGVCLTAFGDPAEELEALLTRKFPQAEFEAADARTKAWARATVALVEGDTDAASASDIPVDLRGTPFQLDVWEQLRAIPAGSTITYGELARRVGRPKAVRAVAQACGANPVGVIVPCHRVIGSDGSLTGFASGIDRKRTLLEREGAL